MKNRHLRLRRYLVSTLLPIVVLLAVHAFVSGCREQVKTQLPSEKMVLSSPGFADGQPIPELYIGRNSPPLNWSNVPAGTKSLALTCKDLTGTHNNFIHWVAYDIPESTRSLPAGAGNWKDSTRNKLPGAGYLGPSPTPGTTHRYRFTLYALDNQPEFTSPVVDVEMLERAIAGHVLDSAMLVGTYSVDPGFGGWTK